MENNKTEQFLKFYEEHIKEDREAAFFTFLTALSKNTDNPQNVFFKGDSGIGKTWVVTNVLNLFEEQDIWMLGGLSPTALVHDYGTLVDKHGIEVPMDNRPSKEQIKEELQLEKGEVSKAELEREIRKRWKTWNDNLKDSYYLVDLTGKLLVFLESPHIETFNRLRPILSHDKLEISYRFTDKDKKGGLRTTHVKIRGWPATIFCTTDKTWLQDLATRSLTITPRTSDAKLRAACILVGQEVAYPVRNSSPEKTKFQTELQKIIDYYTNNGMGKIQVLVPYGEQIGENVPLYQPRVMRDIRHILTFIKLNALVNYETRPKIDKIVLATYEDFKQVMTYFQYCEETTVTGLNKHILDMFHKALEPLKVCNYNSLVEKCQEVLAYPLSQATLYVYVRELEKIGWVDAEPDPEDHRKRIIKVIRDKKELLTSLINEFKTFFGLEQFKAWLKRVLEILYEGRVLSNDFSTDWWINGVEDMFYKYYVPQEENMLGKIEPSNNNLILPEKALNGENTVLDGVNSKVRDYKGIVGSCWICGKLLPQDLVDTTVDEGRTVHLGCYKKLKEGLKSE